ncbi:MAG: dTDP-glucose 4,6-dehydratase [Spirochaetes bacterium GWD1_61_31]|nr:MAG: dTDP-glucose 4,6-dehydratase [Spirochaetes bacterium GWB1_60_80]OHD31874.1 MAG: dTDP-glucose 4,6-dehydratase [Spirochaetes bacterium GWC1_61_12]OHD40029.1 MAG: dTDP-glucose 4,6-dehydratase [Spirochaetes bacterium GWD1_61_31]OHD42317.1 MAG: dTDP-glucose 4,6-dehydratase [Spirochaetes bacterium GWE1_60_18]OHD58467.1 MAG: dTDP-glucose 4,6-dehydratase [Spirochaetes bacterium GWF1_60_12]HAW85458.1 dTDP-glucose 4,6-dehydratase [Spirochaetaceae bacterium]
MRDFKTILVTGGAGFIGSNLIRYLLSDKSGFTGRIVNLDALTYAGNPDSLADIDKRLGGKRYFFLKADICDRKAVEKAFTDYAIDAVCHLAAESHVDRSILGPEAFIRTNVMGTFTLLDVARIAWKDRSDVLFHHVSTDEVFGSLGDSGFFTETTPYDPRSPYSASKASSDHLVMAYHHTYHLPVTLTNCSNNYGPYQFPEKLVPVMILNMIEDKPLPVYGDGKNIRDWLYVEDHNSAVWTVMQNGVLGQTYNIGGENEWENIKLLDRLIDLVAEESGKSSASLRSLITYVKDRPGHDRRYAIDCSKLKTELGWRQSVTFDEGLRKTVRWYLDNSGWINRVRSGEYRTWMDVNYTQR